MNFFKLYDYNFVIHRTPHNHIYTIELVRPKKQNKKPESHMILQKQVGDSTYSSTLRKEAYSLIILVWIGKSFIGITALLDGAMTLYEASSSKGFPPSLSQLRYLFRLLHSNHAVLE